MIKKIFSIVFIIIVISCSNSSINNITNLEFETFTKVVQEIPEIQLRLQKLLGSEYDRINSILIKSNPGLAPTIDGLLYTLFADNTNNDQVYVLIDIPNNNILLGYYNASEDKTMVFEEMEGETHGGEFYKWVDGE